MDVIDAISGKYVWILMLVPGFIVTRIYYLYFVEPKKTQIDKILDYVTITAFIIGIDALIFELIPHKELPDWIATIFVVVVLAFVPILTAITLVKFRKHLHKIGALGAAPKAWDDFFSSNPRCFVKAHLTDGRMVGGYYAGESAASTYPHEEDIYLSVEYDIDQATGEFLRPVERSQGVLLKHSAISVIEFFSEE